MTKRITDDHLRRIAAGESKRAIAREIGFSDTALRKRLKTAAVMKRVTALALAATETSSSDKPTLPVVKKPRSVREPRAERPDPQIAPAATPVPDVIVTRRMRWKGGVGDASYEITGPSHDGRMHVGWTYDREAVDPHAGRVRLVKGSRVLLCDPAEADDWRASGWRG